MSHLNEQVQYIPKMYRYVYILKQKLIMPPFSSHQSIPYTEEEEEEETAADSMITEEGQESSVPVINAVQTIDATSTGIPDMF